MAVLALLLLALVSQASASCCSGMVMNSLGIQLTESSEGYVDHVYDDSAGNPTVCYGHLVTAGQTFPAVVSQAECTQLLEQDMGTAEGCVQNSVNVPLNTNQFSALVDFTFNLGCGALQSSTLLSILNQGNYAGVPAQMMRWVYAGGQELPGLVTRRQNEGTLWNTPVSGGGTTAGASTAPATQPATQPASTASAVANTQAATTQASTEAATTQASTQPATTQTAGSTMDAEAAAATGSSSSSSVPVYGVVLIAVGAAALVLAAVGAAVMKLRARQAAPLNEALIPSTETI